MPSDKHNPPTRLQQAPTKKVGVIVLAAGFSRRFGAIKLNAKLNDGSTVIAQTLSRIRAASDNVVVVTRPELLTLVLENGSDSLTTLICPNSDKGMGHTLAYGIKHIRDWAGCLVCLADMPFITTETYQMLLNQLHEESILVPMFEGQRGNPVGFGAQWFEQLANSSGDVGARDLMKQEQVNITRVAVDDPAILQDIDTPEDLVRYQEV
ncbi:MAG: nucleotidyltransferase family protein [Gammaproteobacteria bacterium]